MKDIVAILLFIISVPVIIAAFIVLIPAILLASIAGVLLENGSNIADHEELKCVHKKVQRFIK